MDIRHYMNLAEAANTPLFFVPIRYWESKEPLTGHLVEKNGDSIYAYHDGYGHNVYMNAKDVFLTREEAIAEAERRIVERDAQAEAEVEEMMARIDGTHQEEPSPPKIAAFVPDVGAIVEYGLDGFGKNPATYRVSGWLKSAPPPAPPSDQDGPYGFLRQMLYQTQQKVGPDSKRLKFCTREEAEYLNLVGVAGAIARVGEVKVVGRVSWDEETIDQERQQAIALAGRAID